GLVDGDRQDDVGDDQDLESEQDRAADVVAERRVCGAAPAAGQVADVEDRADDAADHENENAAELEQADREVEELFEGHASHGPTLAKARITRRLGSR